MDFLTTELQSTFDSLGLTELTGLMITITAMSGSFYFIVNIIRPWLNYIWAMLERLCYYEIEAHISDSEYYKLDAWLYNNRQYTKFQRAYKLANDSYDEGPTQAEDRNTYLVAGYGSVLIKAPGFPFIWVTRKKDESKQVFRQTEMLTFKIISLWSKSVDDFFDRVISINDDKGPWVYKSEGNWWQNIGSPKVVLEPLGEPAQQFIDDVDDFLANEEEYKVRGISYKRGYLLHGAPGTGKTSIVSYLAHKNNMNVYLMSSQSITKFESLRSTIRPNSIILIEDIDMTIAGESRDQAVEHTGDDQAEKTLEIKIPTTIRDYIRSFLNTLDGLCEFQGSIIVATTNKPQTLDAALLRPGRIDKQIEITSFGEVEQIQHINRFFDVNLNPKEYVDIPKRTFAELQFLCVSHMNDFDTVKQLLRGE